MAKRHLAIFIILFLASALMAIAGFLNDLNSVAAKVEEGNRLFFEGDYEGAEKWYRDAQIEDPTSSRIHLNTGDVLHKQDKRQEAISEYQKALPSDEPALEAMKNYNIGNSFFKENMLTEALGSYKKALDINAYDQDAKFNLEIVQNRLDQIAGVFGKSLELVTGGKVDQALSLVTMTLVENPQEAAFLSEHRQRLEIIANVIAVSEHKSGM